MVKVLPLGKIDQAAFCSVFNAGLWWHESCRGVETVRKWHFVVVQQTIADKVIGLRMGERELAAVDLVNDLTLIGPYLTKAGAM